MLVLAYLGLLALIPLVVERNDREVQWHAKHGLVLLAAEVVLYFGLAVVTWFMPLLGVFFFVLTAGIFVLHLAAILKAIKGERLLIPGLSDYADRF